jgi:hypothetical protein
MSIAEPDATTSFVITDGKQFLGSRSRPTTYGHELVYMTASGPATDLGKTLADLELPAVVVREIEPDSEPEPLFHQPKAYVRYSTLHSPDDIAEDDASKVIYEIDSDDEAWLEEHSVGLDAMDASSSNGTPSDHSTHHVVPKGEVDVESFEWMMQWLERKAFVEHQRNEMFSTRHAVQYDDTPCAVCREKESNDLNQIVICDGCEMAVHQNCYGVRFIPEGAWLCEACSRNLDPSKLTCDLCGGSGHGGSFKPLEKPMPALKLPSTPSAESSTSRTRTFPLTGFAHVQCALWLPYAEFASKDCVGNIHVRYNAKSFQNQALCHYCTRARGATVKCSNSTCDTWFHVICGQKKCFVLIRDSRDHYIAWCDRHTPEKYQNWRKEAIRTSGRMRQTQRRTKKLNEGVKTSALLKTASRRSDLASVTALRYWSGLIALPSVTAMLDTMERLKWPLTKIPSANVALAIFEHWTKKRTKSRGVPLLKALHPSNVDCNGTVLLNMTPETEIASVYARLVKVRIHLESMRSLAAALLKRERMKRSITMAKIRLAQNILDPVRAAQIHVLRTAATDFDTLRLFGRSATVAHPYDWETVSNRLEQGMYDEDGLEEGGGSFFRDLLKVVDPTLVPPHLALDAQFITQQLLQLQSGAPITLQKTVHPLSIMLPSNTVKAYRQAIFQMQTSEAYRDMV